MENRGHVIDTATKLQDAGLVAASAAGTYVLDLGAGRTTGYVLIDASAVEVDSGDELYTISLQGTNTAAFAGTDIVDINMIQLGDAVPLPGASDKVAGLYQFPFDTFDGQNTWRYVRLYITIAGTIATGINFVAYLSK
jgi:hypothetical protein